MAGGGEGFLNPTVYCLKESFGILLQVKHPARVYSRVISSDRHTAAHG